MYYIINNNNLMIAKNLEALEGYNNPIKELPEDYEKGKYIVVDGELILNPNWEEEQATLREINFKNNFFEIPNVGWYRKVPRGYSSAIESLNTAFNNFVVMKESGIEEFPADIFIFYQAPDFTKPEECTEEWLIEHQFKNQAMTAQEFGTFYMTFTSAWNNQEHETSIIAVLPDNENLEGE